MALLLDSELLFPVIIGSLLFTLLAVFFIAFFLQYQKKRQQHQLEKEKLASDFAETLLQAQLEIQEQTLQNVSYELHDNLGQIASLIKIQLNTISLSKPEHATARIAEAKALTKSLIKDLKLLTLDLNGDRIGSMGLVSALVGEVEKLNKTGVFKATLSIQGNEFTLPTNITLILYRMAQETINNIIKHSQASLVTINIIFTEKMLTLVFNDNGLGFNFIEKLHSGGNGLFNLKNRAAVINATFNIESLQGEGTTVTVEIPKP